LFTGEVTSSHLRILWLCILQAAPFIFTVIHIIPTEYAVSLQRFSYFICVS